MSLLSIIGCGNSQAQKYWEGTPKSYLYKHDVCMMYPAYWYNVVPAEDGTLLLKYSKYSNDIKVYHAPADALEHIGSLVREYRLYNLKDSYQPPFQVYDGYSWHVEVSYDKASIWSGGNNARPSSRHEEGLDAINAYLDGIMEAAGEDGVIAIEQHR